MASQLPVLEDTDFESEILKDEVEHVVEILTSHLCSDEGLEDCTEVLIALSMCHLSLRIQVLRHLLKGKTHIFLYRYIKMISRCCKTWRIAKSSNKPVVVRVTRPK